MFDFKRTWGPVPRYPKVLGAKSWTGGESVMIAGPCSVESPEQINTIAKEVALLECDLRHVFLRGGIYKAGTYPPPKREFGLKMSRLLMLKSAARRHGLKTIVEVLDVRLVRKLAPHVDAFQVGARHCQDYALLEELAKTNRVVALKRNMGMTLDEFMGAAEYLARGRCNPLLIERGGSSHMNHVRWDISVSLIAAVKRMTGLPIIVDASHGTGRRDLVEDMTLAGIAAGADGFLVECHPEPCQSLTDTDQAFPLNDLLPLSHKAALIRHLRNQWKKENK